MDEQALTLLLAQGLSVERIAKRYGKRPATVSYWMKKYGLTAANRDKHVAKGGIEREQLAALVESGKSIGQIAITVGRSKGTVRHWLASYGLKTQNGRGTRQPGVAAAAKAEGRLTVTMTCRHHGEAEFVLEGRGYYRCKRCRAERVAQRRRNVKVLLVREAGGKCVVCGYDRCVGALHFHHLDPQHKRFHVSLEGAARSLERVRAEAQKCVLLCANCHAEVENDVTKLPLECVRHPEGKLEAA